MSQFLYSNVCSLNGRNEDILDYESVVSHQWGTNSFNKLRAVPVERYFAGIHVIKLTTQFSQLKSFKIFIYLFIINFIKRVL